MKPDGTVVIDTKIKTDGAQVGIEEIKNTLGKVTDTIDSYNKSVQEYVDNYVANMEAATTVSYTHLTLPTILRV